MSMTFDPMFLSAAKNPTDIECTYLDHLHHRAREIEHHCDRERHALRHETDQRLFDTQGKSRAVTHSGRAHGKIRKFHHL